MLLFFSSLSIFVYEKQKKRNMWSEDIDSVFTRFYIATHMTVCVVHVSILIHILLRDSHPENREPDGNNHDDEWFQKYLYQFIVVVYHFVFDIYRLTQPHEFVHLGNSQDPDALLPPAVVLWYLFSYAMRMTDEIPHYPRLGDIVFKKLEDATAWFNVYHLQGKAYALCFSLRILPGMFMMLVNASTYVLADIECDNALVCIYSWEHWFQLPIFLGWIWLLPKTRLGRVGGLCLLVLSFVAGLIPFFFLDFIFPIALLSCLFYESLHSSVGLYYLWYHDHQDHVGEKNAFDTTMSIHTISISS
jgi:hypothetical protein